MARVLRLNWFIPLVFVVGCQGRDASSPDEKNAVRIVSFAPQGQTDTRPIEVKFSQPMVEAGKVGSDLPGSDLLVIEPPLPGRAKWTAQDLLLFVPGEPFRRSTRYQVTIRPEVAPAGKKLAGNTSYRFHSPLFALQSVEPFFSGAGAMDVRLNVEFNFPVKPEDAQGAVHFLDGAGKQLRAVLETKHAQEVMAFRLESLSLTEDPVPLKVAIAPTLAASFGGEPLGKEVLRDVMIRRPQGLRVEQVYPVQEGGQFVVVIRLSDEVDEQSLQQVLTLEPKVKFAVAPSYRGARLVGPFKPGSSYTLTIKKGLIGRQGGVLEDDLTRQVVIEDLEPAVRFASDGRYLAKDGKQKIAVESVNVKKLHLSVEKVLENNLVHVLPRLQTGRSTCWDEGCGEDYGEPWYGYGGSGYNYYGSLETFGTLVETGDIALREGKNEWQTTAVSFGDIDKEIRTGLYRLRVADAERSWSYVEKWLLSTDLGLTAKVGPEEARVHVLSLSSLRPAAGVEVQFISQTNQHLGRAMTDGEGWATLSLKNQKKGEPLALVTAKRGDDFSYLALSGTMIPTADFDVGGQGDTGAPYQAYVVPDRGVYRPGDTAHVAVIVRDNALRTPPVFPYTLEVRNPQWRVFQTLRGVTDSDGGRAFDVAIPLDALTGRYAIRVLGAGEDTILGHAQINVEEFMPDRIKVDAKAATPVGEADHPSEFAVESAYLFGPPAKGLKVDATCAFREEAVVTANFNSFTFGGGQGRWVDYQEDQGEAKLDDAGRATFSCSFNGSQTLRLPLRVSLYATVSEAGGRAVTGAASALVHGHPHYVGVRRNGPSAYAEAERSAGLEAVVVGRQGEAKAGVELTADVVSIEWKSVLKLEGGRYRYVSEKAEAKVQSFKLKSGAGPVAIPFTPKKPGSYRVDVTAQPSGSMSSTEFWVTGPGWAPWEMSKPDQVAMTLDKPSYSAGESARVMIRAPFDGRLLITVERDRVLYSTSTLLTGNSGAVTIPVSAAMTPNAYVVAELFRSPGSAEKLAPTRAFGIAPLKVNADSHKLMLKLEAPQELRPQQPLMVELVAEGATGPVQVTVAAIDEGILRITDHPSPDPFAYFTQKRRLSVTSHDLFDALLPEVDLPASAMTRAGGGDATRKKHLTPVSVKRVKPVALWSGLVQLDPTGRGQIRLEVPQFQGSLRVMAMAFQGEHFGAAAKNVTVRDPIVLTPTLPRFVGPLDRFSVPVELFNGTGKDGSFELTIEAEGVLKVQGDAKKSLSVKAGEQAAHVFTLLADELAGKGKVTLRAKGGGAETFAETELPVRPASTVVTEGAALLARYAEPAKYKIPGGFLPGTMKVRIGVAGVPAAQFGSALQYLLQYPYGCLEQTTSKTFPLLYLKDLIKVSAPELAADTSADTYIAAGVDRVLSMLQSNGWFSYWPGSSWGYPWTTVYAAHFLVEAKKAGHRVDPQALDRILGHLAQLVHLGVAPYYPGGAPDFRTQAYAIYVLALANRPSQSAAIYAADRMRAVAEGHLKDGTVVIDHEVRALIGGALLLGGDRTRAQEFLGAELAASTAGKVQGFWSPTRADALLLSVLADIQPAHKSVPALMSALTDRAKVGRWTNTTENAISLMALGKIGRALGGREFWGTLRVGGQEIKKFNHDLPASVVNEGSDWVGKDVDVTVTGQGTAFISVQVEGIRAGLLQPSSNGIEISRAFLSKAGTPIDPKAIHQGDLVVTQIELTAPVGTRLENVAVVDLLPAGLEIENPRLSGELVEPWMHDRAAPEYMDIRDDRIFFFLNINGGSKHRLYYTARAVTAGEFILPLVHAEAMYDPAIQAQNSGGKVVVAPR